MFINGQQIPNIFFKTEGFPQNVKMGEFTPTNINGNFTVEHGLGVTPKYVFCWLEGATATGLISAIIKLNLSVETKEHYIFYEYDGFKCETTSVSSDDNETTFTVPATPKNVVMPPVYKYKWLVAV